MGVWVVSAFMVGVVVLAVWVVEGREIRCSLLHRKSWHFSDDYMFHRGECLRCRRLLR